MVDDSEGGADTVRGGVPPLTALRSAGEVVVGPSAEPAEPAAVALPPPLFGALDVTRPDSPLARSRADTPPPPSGGGGRYRVGERLGEGGVCGVLLAPAH